MERKEPFKLGDSLRAFLRGTDLEKRLAEVKVTESWDYVVGRRYSDATAKATFENGVLTCRIPSSVLRMQLQFDLEIIRYKINEYLGGEVVKSIRLY